MTHNIAKYLARYAEPEAQCLREQLFSNASQNQWQYCLVLPTYRETQAFYHRLIKTLLKKDSVLLILVINQPDSLGENDTSNLALWHNIINDTLALQSQNNLQLRNIPNTNSAALLVDRFTNKQQIPSKQGVGLARKIGADIALALIQSEHVQSPWIYTSDADAHLPDNYFSALDSCQNGDAAAIYPFSHHCDDNPVGKATKLYELKMQQYVGGLQSAGSPYAFHTIGSTLAVNASHYALVRGFPKRSGGEDFYLLNKLAKTGNIRNLKAPKIILEARQSDRVPFGTGPAINKLLTESELSEATIFYNPQVFIELGSWLAAMPSTQSSTLDSQEDLNNRALSTATLQALQAIGIDKAISSARKISKTPENYGKHLHTWFDGFKTLKFIHQLRDSTYPNVSLKDL